MHNGSGFFRSRCVFSASVRSFLRVLFDFGGFSRIHIAEQEYRQFAEGSPKRLQSKIFREEEALPKRRAFRKKSEGKGKRRRGRGNGGKFFQTLAHFSRECYNVSASKQNRQIFSRRRLLVRVTISRAQKNIIRKVERISGG